MPVEVIDAQSCQAAEGVAVWCSPDPDEAHRSKPASPSSGTPDLVFFRGVVTRNVYRPDSAYFSSPAFITTPRGGHMGEGQLLYQIGE